MGSASIVIAEHGADWLEWASTLRSSTDGMYVIVQDVSEKSREFAERVTRRLDVLAKEGTSVRSVAYVGNAASSAHSNERRSRLLRQVSSMLGSSELDTQLYVDAPRERRSRHWMTALVWALRDWAAGSGLSVSVTSPAALAA
jgi:hypothetical protein